jgi:hypothetical protein
MTTTFAITLSRRAKGRSAPAEANALFGAYRGVSGRCK